MHFQFINNIHTFTYLKKIVSEKKRSSREKWLWKKQFQYLIFMVVIYFTYFILSPKKSIKFSELSFLSIKIHSSVTLKLISLALHSSNYFLHFLSLSFSKILSQYVVNWDLRYFLKLFHLKKEKNKKQLYMNKWIRIRWAEDSSIHLLLLHASIYMYKIYNFLRYDVNDFLI